MRMAQAMVILVLMVALSIPSLVHGSSGDAPEAEAAPADGGEGSARTAAKAHRRPRRGPLRRRAARNAEAEAEALEDRSAERLAILERLRLAHDPNSYFAPDIEHQLISASWAELPEEEEVEVLLQRVLSRQLSLQQRVELAQVELEEVSLEELRYFGASFHVTHPPVDFYRDPAGSIDQAQRLHLDEIDLDDFDFPIVINEWVVKWMHYFLGRGRRWFVRWIGRRDRYATLIRGELEAADMPQDLLYLSMIESGYQPYATSWAKAVGLWQFMPATGRRFNLAIDWWRDERRDPARATKAAIQYLSYLHRFFDGDWALAASAYNAGEGRIRRALEHTGASDYWELIETDHLAAETRNYVPKLIAAAILSHYPERYGLLDEIPDDERYEPLAYEDVVVPDATDLAVIARLVGSDEETLGELNPALKRGYTPPEGDYVVHVPVGRAEGFAEAYAALPVSERLSFRRYRVQRGDSLSVIADRFGVTAAAVQRVNRIRNANRLRVGQDLVIPVRVEPGSGETISATEVAEAAQTSEDSTPQSAAAPAASREATTTRSTAARTHRVRRGQSLSSIALANRVTVEQLRRWNGVTGSRIFVGQVLSLEPPRDTSGPTEITHTVARGESLSVIANEHRVSVTRLKQFNRLRSDRLQVGQELRIPLRSAPANEVRVVEHRVARGESLWRLAARYGVSVETLRRHNEISGDGIQVGQRLTIPVPAGMPLPQQLVEHRVNPGESLSRIAERYDVRVTDLKSWNNLRSDRIRVGQVLKIRQTDAPVQLQERHHIVRRGDTLSELAERYGVRSSDIRSWNDLGRSSSIQVGQRLTIRTEQRAARTQEITYRVRRGDSLWSIAESNGVAVADLVSWNDLDAQTIFVGQNLTIRVRR